MHLLLLRLGPWRNAALTFSAPPLPIRQFEDGLMNERAAPRRAGHAVQRIAFAEPVARRIAACLSLPSAFQPAVAIDPMTGERRRWSPALACRRRAANSRKVVIAMAGKSGRLGPGRDPPRLNQPEFCEPEYDSGFCEFLRTSLTSTSAFCAAGR